jgi:hypothetical protein
MTQNENFYIFDCNGAIVGNPNGYKTIRAALAQQNRAGSPAFNAIWAAFDKQEKPASGISSICKITQIN